MDINYICYSSAVALSSAVIIICGLKMLNWLWFRPKQLEKWMRQQGFKGDSYRFLIGGLKEISAKSKEARSKPIDFSHDIVPRLLPSIHQSVQKYGKNYFFWFGPKPTAVISDPEMVKEILSKNHVFHKVSTPFDELLARGLAVYEMDKWAKHRKLINPAFNLEKLKNMLPSFYLSCCDMLSKWEKTLSNNHEGNCCEIDVWPYLQTLTSDVISRSAFGSNYEEGRKIFQLQRQQGELLLMHAILLFTIPGWRYLPTKQNRRLKQNKKEVESLILEIINKRMKAIESGEANTDDLLGILLESNFKEIQENGNEFGMSLQEVIEECKLFYLAGQETTSSLLVWTMILLSKHMDWQARARAEVLQVVTSEKPDFHELNHLKIVTMIFHEVLRLYPPAILLTRTVHKETTIGNVTLPAGMQLLLPTISLQHDCTIWGDDAKEFNPERFSEGVWKATIGQFVYFPFGGGPRICIGQNFAMLEAKMALAMILRHYSFELSPSYAHGPHSVLTLRPQYGAHLILRNL